MKRNLKLTALLLSLVLALLALASCSAGNVAKSGTATVVIENAGSYEAYEVDLSNLEKHDEGALTLLEYLAVQEDSKLYYSATWGGGYGAYLNSIGSLSPDPSSEYISVYTTTEKDFAVPNDYMSTVKNVEYGGKVLTYSGVGISQMTIENGTVVLFRVEGF